MVGCWHPSDCFTVATQTEQLLRRWRNQGAVRAGQQGWGGTSRLVDLNYGMADRAASERFTRYVQSRCGLRWQFCDRYRQASAKPAAQGGSLRSKKMVPSDRFGELPDWNAIEIIRRPDGRIFILLQMCQFTIKTHGMSRWS